MQLSFRDGLSDSNEHRPTYDLDCSNFIADKWKITSIVWLRYKLSNTLRHSVLIEVAVHVTAAGAVWRPASRWDFPKTFRVRLSSLHPMLSWCCVARCVQCGTGSRCNIADVSALNADVTQCRRMPPMRIAQTAKLINLFACSDDSQPIHITTLRVICRTRTKNIEQNKSVNWWTRDRKLNVSLFYRLKSTSTHCRPSFGAYLCCVIGIVLRRIHCVLVACICMFRPRRNLSMTGTEQQSVILSLHDIRGIAFQPWQPRSSSTSASSHSADFDSWT